MGDDDQKALAEALRSYGRAAEHTLGKHKPRVVDTELLQRSRILPVGQYQGGIDFAWPETLNFTGDLPAPGEHSDGAAGQVGQQAVAGALNALTGRAPFAVPKNAVGTFGGKMGADMLAHRGRPTAKEALAMAKELEAKGHGPESIRRLTNEYIEAHDPRLGGVVKAPDAHWKFEMADNEVHLTKNMTDNFERFGKLNLGEGLYKPGNTTLDHRYYESRKSGELGDVRQAYPSAYTVALEGHAKPGLAPVSEYVPSKSGQGQFYVQGENPEQLRTGLVNAVQGYIDHREGHGVQMAPWEMVQRPEAHKMAQAIAKELRATDAVNTNEYLYDVGMGQAVKQMKRRLAGEVQSRAVMKRMNMSPEELRRTPPTWDVPPEEIIQATRPLRGGNPAMLVEYPPHKFDEPPAMSPLKRLDLPPGANQRGMSNQFQYPPSAEDKAQTVQNIIKMRGGKLSADDWNQIMRLQDEALNTGGK